MLAKFYQNTVLKKPGFILVLLLTIMCFFGYFSKNFRLDASSETLLIEGDPDLKYLNEIPHSFLLAIQHVQLLLVLAPFLVNSMPLCIQTLQHPRLVL